MSGMSSSARNKRLITEQDVARLEAGSRLVVDRDTIVTPAARDLAYARGIDLAPADGPAAKREQAEQARNVAPLTGPWPTLPDGDYLLEVRNGRVRARRVSD